MNHNEILKNILKKRKESAFNVAKYAFLLPNKDELFYSTPQIIELTDIEFYMLKKLDKKFINLLPKNNVLDLMGFFLKNANIEDNYDYSFLNTHKEDQKNKMTFLTHYKNSNELGIEYPAIVKNLNNLDHKMLFNNHSNEISLNNFRNYIDVLIKRIDDKIDFFIQSSIVFFLIEEIMFGSKITYGKMGRQVASPYSFLIDDYVKIEDFLSETYEIDNDINKIDQKSVNSYRAVVGEDILSFIRYHVVNSFNDFLLQNKIEKFSFNTRLICEIIFNEVFSKFINLDIIKLFTMYSKCGDSEEKLSIIKDKNALQKERKVILNNFINSITPNSRNDDIIFINPARITMNNKILQDGTFLPTKYPLSFYDYLYTALKKNVMSVFLIRQKHNLKLLNSEQDPYNIKAYSFMSNTITEINASNIRNIQWLECEDDEK